MNMRRGSCCIRSIRKNRAAQFADDEKKTFGNTLRNIQRLTTIKRDGVRYADRAGDH